MIILNGNIAYFNLSGLLRFLYSNKLTGILRIQKKDRTVNIHILSGKTLGIEPMLNDPIEQLVEVSTWVNGEFSFELASEEKISRNITVPHDQLTLLIAKKEKEFKELKSSLPPMDAVLVMSAAGGIGEIRLQPNEWNLLSKVDGKKSLEELVHAVDLDEVSAFAIVVKLIQKGILNVVTAEETAEEEIAQGKDEKTEKTAAASDAQGKKKVSADKMKELEKAFMRYVGPMGTIIVDEILEGMKLDREEIHEDVLPELIEKMSVEIESEDDRRQFDEEVLKVMGLDGKI